MKKQKHIISYIQKENILDRETLQDILNQHQSSGKSIINIIKDGNFVDDEQLTRIVAAGNKIEFVNLSPDMVDPMAARMVTYEMASRHNMIPLKQKGNKLLVAMSSPLDLVVRDQLEVKTGCKIIPLAAAPNAIRQAIRFHFNVENVTRQAIASMRLKQDVTEEKQFGTEIKGKSARVANDPVTKLVSSIIAGAIDYRASDIHIEPQEPDMRVRYRIDGLLRNAIDVPSSVQKEVISHIKIQAEMDISEKRIPQDGHIAIRHDSHEYDLRVSSLPAVGGEKIVLRILDKSTNRWSFDKVVTSPEDNRRFRSLMQNAYGMLLLTGPTGSGKTTTLYSLLGVLNKPERNIVTVEDPVEYRLDGITQIQVRPAAGMTFASALRSILRQDPDIILIGEIRDLETAEIAVSAALTGHLVLSTLHTNDATGAISRLVNLGIPPFLVASSLLGTIAQRLVRTVCPRCKQPYSPSPEELKQISCVSETEKDVQLYHSSGCNDCFNMGYLGRKAIYEILSISQKIRKLIVTHSSDDDIKQQAVEEGMNTLHASAIEQAMKGQTTLNELLRVIDMRTE